MGRTRWTVCSSWFKSPGKDWCRLPSRGHRFRRYLAKAWRSLSWKLHVEVPGQFWPPERSEQRGTAGEKGSV